MKFLASAMMIYFVLCIICFIFYLPRMRYYLEGFKKQKRLTNEKKNKLAVIIPAREESKVIGKLLDSLKKQTYDKKFFDIHVIVAREGDETLAMTQEYFPDAHTYVITNQTCKAEALDGCLKQILEKNPDTYDAYIIIDADNIAKPDCLEEFNNALAANRQIVLGKKLVKNWLTKDKKCRSTVSNCGGLVYTCLDVLGNKYRTKKGIPCSPTGTGMLVRADVIRMNAGWPYRSLTEDLEMMMDCILKDFTSMYYEYAQVYTEEPVSHSMSIKRRIRWLTGYAQCNKKYLPAIKHKTFKEGKVDKKNFDFLYGLLPVYIFCGLSGALVVLNLVGFIFGLVGSQKILFWASVKNIGVVFLVVYAVLFLYTLLALIVDAQYNKMTFWENIKVIFYNPIFMIEFVPIVVRAFMRTNDFDWAPIERIVYEDEKTESEDIKR